jgi:hypothetical protein
VKRKRKAVRPVAGKTPAAGVLTKVILDKVILVRVGREKEIPDNKSPAKVASKILAKTPHVQVRTIRTATKTCNRVRRKCPCIVF